MAPFPSRHLRKPSDSLLPTIHSPPSLSLSTSSTHSYPPLPPSNPASPRPSSPMHETALQRAQRLDPKRLFGGMKAPTHGSTAGVGGVTAESRETVRRCLERHRRRQAEAVTRFPRDDASFPGFTEVENDVLLLFDHEQENHIHAHTFFNDKGFHNHCSHHLLAAYSLGASPALLEDILKLHHATAFKPMPPMAPVEIDEMNWTEHLGDERYYPNYLNFFHRLISTPPAPNSPHYGRHASSAVPVIEQYLLGGEGQMLVRAVSGAIHPLIHIGHGVEFGLDEHVAEGLAMCAVHDARVASLFPEEWPPRLPKPSQLQSTLSSAISSLRFAANGLLSNGHSSTSAPSSAPGPASTAPSTFSTSLPPASPSDSFARTAASLPRDRRYPREGLSGFTILARILHDDALAPGNAGQLSDMPKLDAVLRNRAGRIVQWCEEWKFSTEKSAGWEDAEPSERRKRAARGMRGIPSWDECVEKCEELFWMATVVYAAATRPGYRDIKLDFFDMHGLTSVLFLPPLLEAVSPHLRPYLLVSHFRILIAYWISRGRPELYITETLMAASAYPRPPDSTLSSPRPRKTAVRRALDEALVDRHSSQHDPHESRPTSPMSGASKQNILNEGYVESPLTPKASDDHSLSAANGFHGSAAEEEYEDGADERVDEAANPWMKALASAVDHHDEHVTKVVRSLFFAATHFGHSEKGMFTSSLPGTEAMDGTIFIRAAGLTLDSMGWAHEGDPGHPGSWDRSALGYPSTWDDSELLPGASWPPPSRGGVDRKGKSRASSFASNGTSAGMRTRSGTVVASPPMAGQQNGLGGAQHDIGGALLSPRPSFASGGGSRSASPSLSARSRSPSPGVGAAGSIEGRQGWRKVGEVVTDEERERRAWEEEERELMA
ncbi:hypothetical protein Rt10032_c06g2983 [Rhodotorula toruloides]|uniref:Uncharacterized protein n=1 Tax=Rhodotorula toruloides TaxID=5286 RepID=A0A511KGB4_RHOTO|nr:hypothetical protein Rt10032_c06g2983 [Rhodotorula toruloides]